MIVDDSAVARSVLSHMLARHAFEIVASVSTAVEAVAMLKRTAVDIVLLDLEMPGGSGLEALPEIARHGNGARILVVSSMTEQGSQSAVQALALGAADTLAKPGDGIPAGLFSDRLVEILQRLLGAEGGSDAVETIALAKPVDPPGRIACLAIGASTGGLHAITLFLRALPGRLGVPLLVTQHLPTTFLPLFARQIELSSGRSAKVAQSGMTLAKDEILIAPGDGHLGLERVRGEIRVRLSREPQESGYMPAVDVMLAAVAEIYGAEGAGIVLSGMGRDGLAGSRRLADAGGPILVQDRESSAVWGMPGSISRAGLARLAARPEKLAQMIQRWMDAAACR